MQSRSVSTIARNIIDVVEGAGHSVTLMHINKCVPGFAEADAHTPSWEYVLDDDGPVIWAGMTLEGCDALKKVLQEGLVALEYFVPRALYFVEGGYLDDPNWWPVALAPARLANVCGNGRLLYFRHKAHVQQLMELARNHGSGRWQCLKH